MINKILKTVLALTFCLIFFSGSFATTDSIALSNKSVDNSILASTEIENNIETDNKIDIENKIEKSNYYDSQKASRDTFYYENINYKSVRVDILKRYRHEILYNPTFAEAELINNCINYKLKNPYEKVDLKIASFHVSVVVAACLDVENANYGKLRNVYDSEEEDGFVRLSYLLVKAAMLGINVTVLGQTNASATIQENSEQKPYYREDYDFEEYFISWMDRPCLGELAKKKVSDFLKFKKSDWTSYGDRSASDMMHLKSCTVSNYIGNDGKTYGNSVLFTSTNIDGVDHRGSNGNESAQTGTIISDHKEIYDCTANFTELVFKYSDQENVYEFREIMRERNQTQRAMILSGNYKLIPQDEKILYLGTETDNTFELFFTPFGGGVGSFDIRYNPFAKFTAKTLVSDDYIEYHLYGVKFATSSMTNTWIKMINQAFISANSPESLLVFYINDFNKNLFSALEQDVNVKSIILRNNPPIHQKDLLVSYSEGGVRQYVSMLTSINNHDGAFFYQANFALAIKETEIDGNRFFKKYLELV